MDVSKKYPSNSTNIRMIAAKIIKGGGGVWGEQAMAAHPQISDSDARTISEYILGLKDAKKASLPLSNQYETTAHKGKKDGAYILQATYSDKGSKGAASLTGTDMVVLRSPKLRASAYDDSKNTTKFTVEALGGEVVIGTQDNAYFVLDDIDLSDIKTITVGAFSQKANTVGGKLEIRAGSLTGLLVGEAEVPQDNLAPVKVPIKKIPATPLPMKLFFVFKNANNDGKPLFAVSIVEFSNK